MSEAFFYHLASPPGEGGIAVFELFGPGAAEALAAGLAGGRLPEPGRSCLDSLLDEAGETLDEVVVGSQPASSMWSGIEAFTLSVHGGSWLQERTARRLDSLGGEGLDRGGVLRHALELGAVDAVQAAACELLLDARTDRSAKFFSRQRSGELSKILSQCVELAEEPVDTAGLEKLERLLRGLVEGSVRARRLGEPLQLLIAGCANTGKSTLFNRFMEKERAAVSSQAGTTRDLLRGTAAIFDVPVELADSVGLRLEPEDTVEAEALSLLARKEADGCLYLLAPPWRLTDRDRSFLTGRWDRKTVLVGNKLDGAPDLPPEDADVLLSALTGEGFDSLLDVIAQRWLGYDAGLPAGIYEDPTAPFTASQAAAVEQALSALVKTPGTPLLDEVKRCLIIGLQYSWPQE